MPRGRTAAIAKLDPLEEIRQLRARQAALGNDLRAKRERLIAEVAEIDDALAELSGAGGRPVDAMATAPTAKPETPLAKAAQQPCAANPGSPAARADALLAELRELAPWSRTLSPVARAAFDLRVTGMTIEAIAKKLGKPAPSVSAAIQYARNRLRQTRTKAKPSDTPASDDEAEPAHVPSVDWELFGADGVGFVCPANDAAPPASDGPEKEEARPTGRWNRADPSEDFTDVEPIARMPAPTADEVSADPPRVEDEAAAAPTLERVRTKMRVIDGRIRAKTVSAPRLSRAESLAAVDYPAVVDRPTTRRECAEMARPCPFVSCSHHLYLDVNPETGALKLNFPHLEVWEMAETCSLDVADRGGIALEEVGAILNLTRERIRQVEVRGLEQIRDHQDDLDLPPDHRGSPLAEAIDN